MKYNNLNLFRLIAKNCKYLQKENKQKKNESQDSFCSLSYLLKDSIELTQSEKIKLGKGLECFLNDLILTNKDWKRLSVVLEFKCQIDDLIINDSTKTIIYSEYKANLALDSQKREVMYSHILKVQALIQKLYPEYKIETFILNLRFLYKQDIPKYILQRFDKHRELPVKLQIIGVNEYLKLFDLNVFYDYTEYRDFLKFICMQKFLGK